VWGWGAGSFGRAFYTQIERAKTTASHDTPIAVAAEQGVIGLIVYVALVAAALVVLFGRGVRSSPARATLAALFVVMIVHSFGYASFLEDPATWAVLALGLVLARDPPLALR
jgi:O-antigen ligase